MRDVNLRQSGRTTRMLIEAHDAKVLGERILIIAPTKSVLTHLMKMARDLGIMDGGVQPTPLEKREFISAQSVMNGKLRGYRGVLFEDHTVTDFGPSKAYSREVHLWQATIVPSATPRWKFQPF